MGGSNCSRQEIISETPCRDVLHCGIYTVYMVIDRMALNI